MRVNIHDIIDEVIYKSNLKEYVQPDGYVFFGIYAALYGLGKS